MFVPIVILYTILCSIYVYIEPKMGKELKVCLNIILILSFVAIISFRPLVVPDTKEYIRIFEEIDINKNYSVSSNLMIEEFDIEVGFLFLIQFVKIIFGNYYNVFFAIIPLINIFLVYIGSKILIECIQKDIRIKENNSMKSYKFHRIIFSIYILLWST